MSYFGDNTRIMHPLFFIKEDEGSIPTSPLQLRIDQCNVRLACKLNRLWHSRFPEIKESNIIRNRRSICFSAEYDGLFYASAIWSDPIAANRLNGGENMLELRRMAIAPDAPKNTASRMISLMVKSIKKKWPELTKLISYQDTEVHYGTIYKASGWVQETTATLTEWDNEKRNRNKAQSTAPKIRWAKVFTRK